MHEFFTVNTGILGQHEQETDSQASQFNLGDAMQHGLKHTMHEQDDKNLKTMFEKVINELRNIEYALNFFIKISKTNKQKKPTLILSNIDKNSSTYNLNKPIDSSNQKAD